MTFNENNSLTAHQLNELIVKLIVGASSADTLNDPTVRAELQTLRNQRNALSEQPADPR